MDFKIFLKKLWNFIWKDNSTWSWILFTISPGGFGTGASIDTPMAVDKMVPRNIDAFYNRHFKIVSLLFIEHYGRIFRMAFVLGIKLYLR